MKYIAIVIGILCLIYIFFLYLPGFFAFFSVFGRKKGLPLTKESMKGMYLEPFCDRILEAKEYMNELPHEDLWITTKDGVKLYGRYIDQGASKTMLFAHGFRAHYMDQFAIAAKLFYDEGYNLLFMCHRAHGVSGGKHSSLGIIEQHDVVDWVVELEKKGAKDIAIYGMSMGCVATSYALKNLNDSNVRVAILDCGYDAPFNQMIADSKKWHIPRAVFDPATRLNAKWILGVDIRENVQESLKESKIPAFFFHGTADESVGIERGKANYEIYGGPKQAVFVEGANHTLSLLQGGKEAEETLLIFVRKYMS